MWYKKGIVNNSGVTVESYQMRDKAIPTNAFCMKADVASSEGANNMELAILYNSACVYKTPAQLEDSRVRHGIDGFPIVIFCSRSFSSWWTPGQRICSRRLLGRQSVNLSSGTAQPSVYERAQPSVYDRAQRSVYDQV